jgi:hypothetical protein
MAEKSEKFLSFDKFKDKVYKHIGFLQSMEEFENSAQNLSNSNNGCFGILIEPLVGRFFTYANKESQKQMKINELTLKADEILARREIKDLLCEKLDATVVLPIDAAYKLTPVLYGLALEDEEKVPFDSMLFAIISKKITGQSVEKYCGEKPKPKRRETKAKK